MIATALAKHLREMRLTCNRQFQEARLRFPHLDTARFSYFLETSATTLIDEIEKRRPNAAHHVAMEVYQHGLELAGLNWVSSDNIVSHQHIPLLATAWERYIPEFVCVYTDHANDVFVMVAHALQHFSLHPGSQALQWLQRLAEILPLCSSFAQWKQAGQILAWQAGLAHFRESALHLANTLPEPLALQLVGASKTERWSHVAEYFQRDPWWVPNRTNLALLQERWRVGAFVEFGGVFHELPTVSWHDGQCFVKSGDGIWLLHADFYGATLHRLGTNESHNIVFRPTNSPAISVSGNHIRYANTLRTLDDIQSISSWASHQTTLAVCSADTFAVIVLSLGAAS